ncbi:conserved hypothetical protein [Lebetimonas natsushimae]|uniref:Glycosyltransferase 2-like domain-containing protein n=1 Tax=Lebetimonas natsushimae TaxID=1936991 RepID=A0A292YBI8_9BACT|nr:glycosyltransferase [Lebetimonas natsushimae]GAX86871.1 conserved hypothetical protein [Lebetimonas natsushimae]
MKNISVIIPAYNEGRNLSKSVLSFINQTVKPLEIIIVDDCSSDNTLNIAYELKYKYSKFNIKILKHNKNKGAGGARNTGLLEARGDIIVFAEADGEYSKLYLQKVLNILERNRNCFTGGGLRVCSNRNKTIWIEYWNSLFEARWILSKKLNIHKGGWVFYKQDIKNIGGYNESLKEGEDIELTNRLLKKGFKSIWIGNVFFKHREPETIIEVFKRFFKAGKNTYKFRKLQKRYYKDVILSILFVVFSPILMIFPHFFIIFKSETRIAQIRLIKKYKKKQNNILSVILFPYQFYFQKMSTALGIIVSFFYEVTKKNKGL